MATLETNLLRHTLLNIVKDIMALDNMSFSSSESTSDFSCCEVGSKEGRSLDEANSYGKHIARLMYPNIWTEDLRVLSSTIALIFPY